MDPHFLVACYSRMPQERLLKKGSLLQPTISELTTYFVEMTVCSHQNAVS
jgi:hypothetical protein